MIDSKNISSYTYTSNRELCISYYLEALNRQHDRDACQINIFSASQPSRIRSAGSKCDALPVRLRRQGCLGKSNMEEIPERDDQASRTSQRIEFYQIREVRHMKEV